MKRLLILALFITGCDASYSDVKQHYKLPPELKDCHVYQLDGDSLSRTLFVVRCPSQTTTNNIQSCGKSCVHETDISVDNIK